MVLVQKERQRSDAPFERNDTLISMNAAHLCIYDNIFMVNHLHGNGSLA